MAMLASSPFITLIGIPSWILITIGVGIAFYFAMEGSSKKEVIEKNDQ